MTDATLAREYQRVSYVATGKLADKSPDEQHADNSRATDRLGWTLGEPYRDKVSASRYSRQVREDYQRLVEDLEHDRFRATVLILWESSRGSRRVSEWCRLIELCEQRGVKIYVTSDGKLYDPAEPRDRRSLLEDAVDSEYESAKTSKRVRRTAAADAQGGRPNGPPPYGYRSTYDPGSGRLSGREPDPAEAPIVVEIFARINAGHSLRSIAADLNRRGLTTRPRRPRGGAEPVATPWTSPTIRTIALNRAYSGERCHDPKGRVNKPSAGAVYYPATWPPLVDVATAKAVRDKLMGASLSDPRPARAVHWLSFIAVCDVCSAPMTVHTAGGTRHFRCRDASCTRVDYDTLNIYVEATLLAYLERDDIAALLTANPTDPAAVAAADADIARVEQAIDDLADATSGGGPAAKRLLAKSLPKLESQLAEARARRERLIAPSRLGGLIAPGRHVARRWKDTPLEVRRQVARIVFVPDLLGELRIVAAGKSTGPAGVPIRDRVTLRRAVST